MTDVVDKITLLARRDLERKSDLAKRKEDRNFSAANNEKLDYFEKTFMSERDKIQELLDKSMELERNELADHFNLIANQILTLQKYVAASNIFLRSYDIKKCQESLQDLSVRSRILEDQLLPKKKFGFKNRPQPKKQNDSKEIINPVDENDSKVVKSIPKVTCGLFNKNGSTLIMGRMETSKEDVCLENLTNCTVYVYGSPSTVHMNGIKGCTIITGPVSTSIFVENCLDTVLVIACQQLRLHSSYNLKIYLHVTSRAIMEDCTEIYVTPYNWNESDLDEDFKNSNLDRSTNNWKAIDDFNWLKVEEKSPNWSTLDRKLVAEFWNHK